jgi:hypothetical protein
MVRFDMKKGAYVRMKLVEKMIDHMDIPSSIIPKVGKLNSDLIHKEVKSRD